MRQPHTANAASPTTVRAIRVTIKAPPRPKAAAAPIQLVISPRLRVAECSAMKMAAPPHSPPSATPWISLRAIKAIGRGQPDLPVGGQEADREGRRAPIMITVIRKAPLRPARSPMRPKIKAPSGRKANPAANEPSANT